MAKMIANNKRIEKVYAVLVESFPAPTEPNYEHNIAVRKVCDIPGVYAMSPVVIEGQTEMGVILAFKTPDAAMAALPTIRECGCVTDDKVYNAVIDESVDEIIVKEEA